MFQNTTKTFLFIVTTLLFFGYSSAHAENPSNTLAISRPMEKEAKLENNTPANQEPLFYTIQLNSYSGPKDADKFFDSVSAKIPHADRGTLRIEKISSFYTVRVGMVENRHDILPLFNKIKEFIQKPVIIKGYIRPERTVRQYATGKLINKQPEMLASSRLALRPTDSETEQDDKAENLIYTIQLSSYFDKEDAIRSFDSLADQIPLPDRQNLRIERISFVYTIRLGKTEKYQEILPLFETIKKVVAKPTIMKAYFRDKRIVHQYNLPEKVPVSSGQPLSKPKDSVAAIFPPDPPAPGSTKAESAHHDPPQADPRSDPAPQQEPQTAFQQKQPPPTPQSAAAQTAAAEIPEPLKNQGAMVGEEAPKTTPGALPPLSQNVSAKLTASKPPSSPQPKRDAEQKRQIPPQKHTTKTDSQEFIKRMQDKYLDFTEGAIATRMKQPQELSNSFSPQQGCSTSDCHGPSFNATHSHPPVAEGKCIACHKPLTQNHPASGTLNFQLTEEDNTLCTKCHSSLSSSAEIIHQPFQEGKCTSCHAPHGSGRPALLTTETQQELCLSCHEGESINQKYRHGPVGLGTCSVCHQPHSSSQQKLLRAPAQTLCVDCHTDFVAGLEDSPFVHTALKEQGCQSCHNPHSSAFPNLLSANGEDFCFTCHDKIEQQFKKSRTKHLGLYLEKQCATCHQAHFSEKKALLLQDEKALCLTCHRAQPALSSYKPKDIASELANKTNIHAPVAEGKCSSCHLAHGSDHDNLLIAKFPSSFYAPYEPGTYELCFICHDQEMLATLETDSSTQFRNGRTNLHYVHTRIARKGRTCKACHSTHASDGPKLIDKTGATFGAWTMSIDFAITGTGGSCTPGCHREMSYDRNTEIDNTTKKESYNKSYIDYESKL